MKTRFYNGEEVMRVYDHLASLTEQRDRWRDNKRDLENSIALKMEEIAALRSLLSAQIAENKKAFTVWNEARDKRDGKIAELRKFVKTVSEQIPEKPDYWSACYEGIRSTNF